MNSRLLFVHYVVSPTGLVHLATMGIMGATYRGLTFCHSKVTQKWDTENEDLMFRGFRLHKVNGYIMCQKCDDHRVILAKQFSRFDKRSDLW